MKKTKKKMRTKWLLMMIFMFGLSFPFMADVNAQTDSIRWLEAAVDSWEAQVGDLDNMEVEEGVAEEVLERMERMTGNSRPNLNDLSYEEAVNCLQLTDYQYYKLQLYKEDFGQLYSFYELCAIEGFTEADMRRLSAVADIAPPPKSCPAFRDLVKSSKTVFWLRYGQVLERQAGYDTSLANHYDGSPMHLQFRYDYSVSSRFGIRFAGEKDPGESFFRGAQKYGFDHYSGAVYIRDIRCVKQAVAGDYRLNFGQGLVLGSSMMSGKGAGVSAFRRFGEGVRPVATTNESQMFRGLAFMLGDSRWSGGGFAGFVTESALSAFGGSLAYRGARFSAGTQFVSYGESSDSAKTKDRWVSFFHPKDINASVSYQLVAGRQLFFGEMAVDGRGHPAVLQAAYIPVAPVFQVATLVRFYATGYHSPMGSGFRVSSGECGEFGCYTTGHLVLSRNVEADLFCDYYRLLWLSYLTDKPAQGMDAGIALTCRLPRRSEITVRYRWKSKSKNEGEDAYLHRLQEQSRHRFRVQWNASPFPFLKTKTEISMAFNKESGATQWRKGLLMYQDLALTLPKPQLSFHLRVAYFDTDSYDERMYAYENDVYYAFTVGSYYYQGMRAYLLLRYKIRKFSVWLRLSQTHYLNRREVGSGLTKIDKPHKTELKVQCMVRI